MKRKIIKQGHNTLTITLPADWTKRFNLQSGDEIDLFEKDNGLFITTEKHNESKSAEFNIDKMDIPIIWKYMMSVYREGYDEVKITFNKNLKVENPYKYFSQHKLDVKYQEKQETKSALEFLHELINRFIGFEIVESSETHVLIKELSQASSKEFENSLRRVFLLIQQMTDETLEAIRKGKPEMLTHIHDVDVNLDKFHDYCIRILTKIGNKELSKTSLLFSTLYLLELVGDEYKTISHHLLYDFGKKQNFKNIEEIAESIKKQLDLFYELFYKFDKEKVLEISKIDRERYFEVKEVYKKKISEQEKEIFHHLRVIARYINALLELRIEMEF